LQDNIKVLGGMLLKLTGGAGDQTQLAAIEKLMGESVRPLQLTTAHSAA
jgi:hypothetical protein